MNQKTIYFELHKAYLLGLDEKTRQHELDQFETVQLHMYDWLQKKQGLSSDQAQDIIDHSLNESYHRKNGGEDSGNSE